LGDGTSGTNRLTPVLIIGGTKEIYPGHEHSIILRDPLSGVAFGRNDVKII
jgi:hypothetical protein